MNVAPNQAVRPRTRFGLAAFSFLELLVILAILGLLASTLLPAFAKSKPNVAAFQCLNNHRQLSAAWRMYADNNKDRIVFASDDGGGSYNPLNQYAWTWPVTGAEPKDDWWWNPAADIYLR